jgi:hypothetical protein
MASAKSRVAHRTANPIETASNPDRGYVRSELSKTANSVKDQLTGTGQDFISQLLGMDFGESEPQGKMGGEMKAGEAIDFSTKRKSEKAQAKLQKPERRSEILGGIDYRSEVIHGSERLSKHEASELDSRIQDILHELKRLIGSSSILKAEFAEISVVDKPLEAGKYYVNFFEWLLIEIKKIRMKVEDAGAWISVMKSKKSLRKYGNMARKHGTSFTLANERTPATQTG